MTTTTTANKPGVDRYLELFARLEAEALRGPQDWLLPLRKSALARFAERGFPTPRDEEWRYTIVTPIVETDFVRPTVELTTVAPEEISAYRFGQGNEILLTFVNGRWQSELSDLTALPADVRVGSLAAAVAEKSPLVEKHLARHAALSDHPFAALNTAFVSDGAVIEIPRGKVLAQPIHLLYVTTPGMAPSIAHPRNLVVAGDGAEFTVVENYVAPDAGRYFNNVVTEFVVGDNALARHVRVVREAQDAFHVAGVHYDLGRDSRVESHSALFGGRLIRNELNPVLGGEGGDCQLYGLYLLDGEQHADNHLRVEHAKPHGGSRQVFRGILNDHARAVFTGRIVVQPDAQKTDAKQTNMNLLLSDAAQVTSKPQLEIFADDVKCTHGSTIGQVDDDAIFYLRTRGISEAAARSMLVYSFARESLDKLPVEVLRKQLIDLVLTRLPGGEQLRETA